MDRRLCHPVSMIFPPISFVAPQNFASDAGAGKQGHTCVAVMVAALIDCQLAGCAPEVSPCDDQGFVDQLPTVFICFRLQITEQIRKSRIQLRA